MLSAAPLLSATLKKQNIGRAVRFIIASNRALMTGFFPTVILSEAKDLTQAG
jgi:hypothetical protein